MHVLYDNNRTRTEQTEQDITDQFQILSINTSSSHYHLRRELCKTIVQ
jgi:hypothetical protein